MIAPTVAVTCQAADQSGQPVAGAVYTATLNQTEISSGFIAPEAVTVVANVQGVATLNLWPNALGTAGSLYRVKATRPANGKKFFDAMVRVPNTACLLHQIIMDEPTPALDSAQQALADAQALLAAGVHYYGASVTNPTTNPLGGAVVAGDLYFNTVLQYALFYTGMAWERPAFETAAVVAVNAHVAAVDAAKTRAIDIDIPGIVGQAEMGGVEAQLAMNADIAAVTAARNLAVGTTIPAKVAEVSEAVAATYVGQTGAAKDLATAAKVAAEAAQALAQAAALASAIALAAKDNIAIGRGLVADGQTFWVKPNLTDGLTRFSAYQRTSSTTQTLIVNVGTGAELDALAGLLVTRSNASINGVLAAWLDSYGRAAGMIGTDGRWTISKLTAKNATIDASTFTLPPSLPGYVMGVKSAALSAVTGMLAAELDSYGRIALALRTDGSLQVSKLRDGAGALVYPQIANIKATADAALAMAAGSGITPGSAKARLQAALAWGNWPRVMASPPVVTIGVANAASTIAGSALVSASDARLQMLYATKTLAGTTYPDSTLYKGVSGHYGASTFSNGVALEFAHTGAALELYCKGTGNSFRIFVDDRLTQEAAYGPMSNVGALFNIKVEFSSSARRRIRVEGIKSWGGVRLALGDTLEAQGRDYPLVVALGDSGWEGTGASLPSGGFSFAMGRALGWNMQSSGLGGTGVLAKGLAGVNTNYLDRLSDLTLAGAAMGIVPVSINDLGQTSDGIRDACYQIYDAWAAVNPASPLVFMGPWVPRGTMPSSGIYALDEGIRKAAWALRCPFVDTLYPNPRTGTGSVIATTGDGNADFYSGFAPSDNLHPSQLGHDHFGLFYAARIKQIILDEI